ncbi:sensor histidine kinase [Hymenobacter humi]|uniref:Sensor histidine kinase n=1 Tax=Hymenobacter humi TaxID=1411620 RepID=A0ABW2U5F6_9BACT
MAPAPGGPARAVLGGGFGGFMLMFLPGHLIAGTPWPWPFYFTALLPTFLLATYSLIYGLLPRVLGAPQRPLPLLLLLLAGWVVAGAVLNNLMEPFYEFVLAPRLFHKMPDRAFHWEEVARELRLGFFPMLLIAGLAGAIKVVGGWHEQQRLRQHLRRQQLQVEPAAAESPAPAPFLFQALRTLRTLTAQKSPDSPAAVLHLSALLRYLLYESQQDAVPLADEVQMLHHYVALERLRLGPGVDVSLSCSGALGAHAIAPLLLLPFVENAFRHGTGPQLECSWVSIDLVASENYIIFKIINGLEGGATERRDGPGLTGARQRLRRLYPDRHEPGPRVCGGHLFGGSAPARGFAGAPAPAERIEPPVNAGRRHFTPNP